MTRVSPFSSKHEVSAKDSTHTSVTANKLDCTNMCPVCDTKMSIVRSRGIPAYYCRTDRVCLPMKDEDLNV